MDKKKYVAYVGTYTHGNSVGIHLFDLDVLFFESYLQM